MDGLSPLDLIAAAAWRRSIFTTYALSLSFFEAVVLDRLTRAGAESAIILSDVEGVRAALSEQGARGVGRDYRVEPISVDGGVFHAKIGVLSNENDHHLLIGSGNLTFGGWGGNLEVLEHLHPSFAADAFDDMAQFFEQFGSQSRFRHQVYDLCQSLSDDLRRASARGNKNDRIRVLHGIDRSIQAKVVDLASDLGGANRLVVASPFWNSAALDGLCHVLGLSEAFVHSHKGGAVRGRLGTNWPIGAKSPVQAVRLEFFDEEEKPRPLHAKTYEIICKRGRIVLSGSANATTAAIGSTHNVEVVVARIQRDSVFAWAFDTAEPPTPDPLLEQDAAAGTTGVLRAELVGDTIEGRVLEPRMQGTAQLFQTTSEGREPLGKITLGADDDFTIVAPTLEVLAWRGDRLTLRLEQEDGACAEGFLTVGSYAEIRRKIGSVAPKLFAILSGTETPADVAAIMSWLQENPDILRSAPGAFRGHGNPGDNSNDDATVNVAELVGAAPTALRPAKEEHSTYVPAWKRFLDSVFLALRKPRGPFVKPSGMVDASNDEDESGSGEDRSIDPVIEQSVAYFDRLLVLFLTSENAPQLAMHAFDLAEYVVDRLQPDFASVKAWLERLVRALCQHGFPPERLNDVVGAILILDAVTPEAQRDVRLLRLRLLRIGADLTASILDPLGAQRFREALAPAADFSNRWNELTIARSMPEQVRAYIDALRSGKLGDGYADIARSMPVLWPTLEAAITDPEIRDEIVVVQTAVESCPRCHIALPVADRVDLENNRVARARNCCHRILVCSEL